MSSISSKTGLLYKNLWVNYNKKLFDHSVSLVKKRFQANKISLNIFKNKKVIDVGCGNGRWCILAIENNAKEVVGIDISKSNVRALNKKFKKLKNLKFFYGDNKKLNFKDNIFDVTISQGVIHHTTDMFQSLSEIIRITKKNGKILLYIYGDYGMKWSCIKQLRPLVKKIGKNKIVSSMKKNNFKNNKIKHFVDDLFVPVQTQTSLPLIMEELKKRKVKKIKLLSKKKTFDHESSIDEYIKEFIVLKKIFQKIKDPVSKLCLKIVKDYLFSIKFIEKLKISKRLKFFYIIGEASHRFEITK